MPKSVFEIPTKPPKSAQKQRQKPPTNRWIRSFFDHQKFRFFLLPPNFWQFCDNDSSQDFARSLLYMALILRFHSRFFGSDWFQDDDNILLYKALKSCSPNWQFCDNDRFRGFVNNRSRKASANLRLRLFYSVQFPDFENIQPRIQLELSALRVFYIFRFQDSKNNLRRIFSLLRGA